MGTRRLHVTTLLALTLALGPAVTACSGATEPVAPPRERLGAAKRILDETSGVRLRLATRRLPEGVSGVLSAAGVATHAPAFAGLLRVSASGLPADVEVVSVEGRVHAMLPFTQEFVEVDPADYGAPDPAALMSTDDGLSTLLTSARRLAAGEDVRDGEQVLSTYTGRVPGDAVAAVIPSASPGRTFDARFSLEADDRVRRMVLTGPFYPGGGAVTYTVDLTGYDVDRRISAP